ncbi:MAG: hypothetical protein HY775_01025 [Acidobacteria bacterium]|nr:hypothetical protein [Acidobacteriota bacterium]
MSRHTRLLAGSLALFLATVLPVPSRPAAASTPSVVVQHWELLSETADTLAQATTLATDRGILPGRTSAFDPEPTATFEASGSVSQGSQGSSWTVGLYGAGETPLAEVSFTPSDSAPTLKAASFSWPAQDTPLDRIVASPVGTLAGTLSIRKAYLAIRQEGTIKATTGRVPMSSKQLAITSTSPTDVADPVLYSHAAGDFHLAQPDVRLRATARLTSGAALLVRLVDDLGIALAQTIQFDPPVGTNSTGSPPSWRSLSSTPLTLRDGRVYRVQVEVDGTAASADLLSVDLVLAQRATDPKGLGSTVAWFPGVSAPQDLTVSGSDLGFLFRAPERSAREETRTWVRTVKTTLGQGSADVVLRDRTAGADRTAPASPASGSSFRYLSSAAADSPAGDVLDSRSALGGMTTGRVSGSALRIRLVLGDIWKPVISGFAATNPAFSPNSDGVKDDTILTAGLSDESPPISWTLDVKDSAGAVVRSFSGPDAPVAATWDGRDSSGNLVPDGPYTAVLSATDDWGNVQTALLPAIVDTAAPTVIQVAPLDGANTIYTSQPIVAWGADPSPVSAAELGSGIDPGALQVVVRDTTGQETEKHPAAQMAGGVIRSSAVSLTGGKQYQALLTARDFAGNETSASVMFLVMTEASTTPPGQISVGIDPLEPTRVEAGGTLDPYDLYTWIFIPVNVGAFSVTLRDSMHAGYGEIRITVPADHVSIAYTIAGVPGPPARPREQQLSLRVPFISGATGAIQASVPAQKAYGYTLTALLPKGVDSGSVRLSLNGVAGTVGFAVCADPTSVDDGCAADPMRVQTPVGEVPLGTCVGGDNTGSVEPPNDGPGPVADCVVLGVPAADFAAGGPAVSPGSDDAPPAQPYGPGKHYFGVWTPYDNRPMTTYGLGGRYVVGDPDIRHDSGCTKDNQDQMANRYMVKAVNPERGAPGQWPYHWVEAGWVEYRHAADDQLLYVAYNDTSGYSGTLTAPFADFNLRPGTEFFMKIERSDLQYNWRVLLWWKNKWNELLNVPMPFSVATNDEVFSEINDYCHNGAFDPGTSYFGDDDPTKRNASRVKYTPSSWRVWNPTNYPSAKYGGQTGTNSKWYCDSTKTTVCYEASWLNRWFSEEFHKP